VRTRKPFPEAANNIYQIGNLILKKVDRIPDAGVHVKMTPSADIHPVKRGWTFSRSTTFAHPVI